MHSREQENDEAVCTCQGSGFIRLPEVGMGAVFEATETGILHDIVSKTTLRAGVIE